MPGVLTTDNACKIIEAIIIASPLNFDFAVILTSMPTVLCFLTSIINVCMYIVLCVADQRDKVCFIFHKVQECCMEKSSYGS